MKQTAPNLPRNTSIMFHSCPTSQWIMTAKVFLTNKACWTCVFILYADDRISEDDSDNGEQNEIESPNDVEQLVLGEHIHKLVVQENLVRRGVPLWHGGMYVITQLWLEQPPNRYHNRYRSASTLCDSISCCIASRSADRSDDDWLARRYRHHRSSHLPNDQERNAVHGYYQSSARPPISIHNVHPLLAKFSPQHRRRIAFSYCIMRPNSQKSLKRISSKAIQVAMNTIKPLPGKTPQQGRPSCT